MLQRFSTNFAVVSLIIDLICVLITAYLTIGISSSIAAGLIIAVWTICFIRLGIYDGDRNYYFKIELTNLAFGHVTVVFVYIGLLLIIGSQAGLVATGTFLLFSFATLVVWRSAARLMFRLVNVGEVRKKVLIVGTGQRAAAITQQLQKVANRSELIGYLGNSLDAVVAVDDIVGGFESLRDVIEEKGIEEVLVALPNGMPGQLYSIVEALRDKPIQVYIVAAYLPLETLPDTNSSLNFAAVGVRNATMTHQQRLVKRLFDILFSALILVLVSPILLITALAIKLDSRGSILFRQSRMGERGDVFEIYKFRSMYITMQQTKLESIKQKNDARVTRVGKLIRRLSIDELPQLINVLKGDMSLVGPRPELPQFVAAYDPWQRTRFLVPQGMTGWWQVNGRADKPLHLNTREDLYYIQNFSVWIDLYILMRTPLVVLRGNGAY